MRDLFTYFSMILLVATNNVRAFAPMRNRLVGLSTMNPLTRNQWTAFSKTTTTTSLAFSSSSPNDSCNASTNNNQWTTDHVRSTFVNFFAERDHTLQPPSPCAPLNDPTLLFTNAGMNQFKPIFLGQVDPNSPLALLKRACNSQKCIRAGGKHNDLEDVGRDTYHHTFFEMLGSWSFGNYFKKEAIEYAWILLTEVYKLDPDRLYATYFAGDGEVEEDVEAKNLWLQYLPPERVIPCSAKDNFWEMGETGPCGPCTEIHYDRIGGRDASSLVNMDDPDVIEIWNIVFIQYNRDAQKLSLLPQKHVDTGMGLERLVSILQNQRSNYDIDVFRGIFDKLAEFSQVGPYEGKLDEQDADLKDTAYRAIADHIRTLSFAIADGAVPNNEGRGYVLRRILRRATRYGQQILQAPPGFFHQLIPVVVNTFGGAYPELIEKEELITEIIAEEEQAFSSMLNRGIKYFKELQAEVKADGGSEVSGEKAFFLYDTLGFPIDLTELMAAEAGMTVDMQGFVKEMEDQKERSRQARVAAKLSGTPELVLIAEHTSALMERGVLPTDDSYKYKWDVDLPATVMAVLSPNGFLESGGEISQGEFVGVVLDKSSFYAEAGGQEADLGTLRILDSDGLVVGNFEVRDVQTYGGFVLHTGVVTAGSFKVGSQASCRVDYERRRQVAPNHSMTHVLNAALREVLGENIEQRGSLCNDEKLRFDFSYKKALTPDELSRIEEFCQQAVTQSLPVSSKVVPLEEAKAIKGVRAIFGEVYPDPVRVVSVGDDVSIEFCGGTHVGNTAEAKAFALVEETAVAKGIRRITAVTRESARIAIAASENFGTVVSELEHVNIKTPGLDKKAGAMRTDLDAAVLSAAVKAELRVRIEKVQKAANEAKKASLAEKVGAVLRSVEEDLDRAILTGERAVVLNVDIGADAKASQRVINTVKKAAPDMAFMGLSEEEPGSGGKLLVFAVVPESLIGKGLKADEWVRTTLEACGGKGGGKPGNAQGQTLRCEDTPSVLERARNFVKEKFA